jgi:hypothetical protein
VVRSVILWFIVAISIVLWPNLVALQALTGRPHVGFERLVAWLDLNASASIGQVLLRPFGQQVHFVPWSAINGVEHRVRWFEPL